MIRWRAAGIILVLCLGLGACVTNSGQPFRGRWWSFYERGQQHLQQGDWTAAESDFRTALKLRGRDQHWARTYGLHLIPDYFPHRDLGIALFRQGRLDESISELETSLEMTFSGACAYFINEARRERIAGLGVDTTPPVIVVHAPKANDISGALDVAIVATVSDDTYLERITVNGEALPLRVSVPQWEVNHTVALSAGSNAIVVEAVDLAGQATRQTIALNADHDGPIISLDEPLTIPGELTGLLWDASEIQGIDVGDQQGIITPENNGIQRFRIRVTAGAPGEPVVLRAEDIHGNQTSHAVPILSSVQAQAGNGIRLALNANTQSGATVLNELRLAAVPLEQTTTMQEPRADEVIQFTHAPDLRVYKDSLRLQLAINTDTTAGAVHLMRDDESPTIENRLPLIPGRTNQRVSRKVALDNGANVFVAQLENGEGRHGMTVTRITPTYELPEYRLNAALLLPVWKENSAVPASLCETMFRSFEQQIITRFNVLDRGEGFDALLLEQQISGAALTDKNSRLAVGQLLGAEIFIEGSAKMIDDKTLSLTAGIISAETSAKRALVEVAGPLEQHEALAVELADLIKQAYPNVPGVVSRRIDEHQAVASLGEVDGVKKDMRCVLYVYGEEILEKNPFTQEIEALGRPITAIGNARIVDLQQKLSTIIRIPGEDAPLPPWPDIPEGDYLWIITK